MQEILQEYPHLDHQYSRRLASVYHDLTDEQAQHLAHRHNRASEYTSKMIIQDKVQAKQNFNSSLVNLLRVNASG